MLHAQLTPALFAAAVLVLGACGGSSPEQKTFDELSARCTAQLGASYSMASAALQGGYPVGPLCSAALEPTSQSDACGAASAEREVCQVLFYWFSADPAVCQGGACVCELRLLRSELDAQQGAAPICAARFLRGQPSP
jgi:hypothetical protein